MYEKLFSPGKIGKLTLKNRLVMTPMGIGLADLDGTPSEDMIAYYEARAKGGCGLIMPEITRVNDVHGVGLMRQLSVTKDRHIKPLSRLAEAVHKYGSKIFIQLHHPGRQTPNALLGGAPAVGASDKPCGRTKAVTRALSTEEVKSLVNDFVMGAVRVQKAGCDGVELHGAHGYIIQQFLSPYTNDRTDEYGGSYENRFRMVKEIIDGIREKCGPDFVLGIRLSVEEFLSNVGVTGDYIHIQDGVRLAMDLEKAGVDFINVSVGLYETGTTAVEPISYPQGWRRNLIKAVKDNVSIPIIAVSCIREPEFAEKFLEEGVTDFIGMGRSWLCDEQWGVKAMEGRDKEIRKCINCLRCFESLEQFNAAGVPAECALNPRLARERKYGELPYDTEHHTAVVVGGGPAGMIAAETLAKRGCKVTLLDRGETLGGTINLAKLPPLKERMEWVMDYYRNAFDRLGVEVKLNTEVTADMVAAMNPDAVILATGAKPFIPASIPGANGANVYTVNEALTGSIKGKKVVVVGAGLTGIETAEYLAANENEVIVADMLDAIAPTANQSIVKDVCGRLLKHNTQFVLGHALAEVKPDGVVLKKLADESLVTIACDAVVMSLGSKPEVALADELRAKGIEVRVVGSAIKDGTIAPASRTAYEAARELFVEDKEPSFIVSKEDIENFGKPSIMDNQEGLYMAYLTDPEAIRKILPPGLIPFPTPVVVVSVCHIQNPNFADDYYEAILGVYCFNKNGKLGQYSVSLVLGGPGAEMATQCGRDNASIPKKLGAEFVIRRDGKHVTASVSRRGVQLIDARMELGEYNHPMTHMLFQAPEAGKHTQGSGFYYHFDRQPDGNGRGCFKNGMLTQLNVEYEYYSWEPGMVDLKLKSSVDDPFAALPIRTIVGGAYAKNKLTLNRTELLELMDADTIVPYLLTARYDRTAFKEPYRK